MTWRAGQVKRGEPANSSRARVRSALKIGPRGCPYDVEDSAEPKGFTPRVGELSVKLGLGFWSGLECGCATALARGDLIHPRRI